MLVTDPVTGNKTPLINVGDQGIAKNSVFDLFLTFLMIIYILFSFFQLFKVPITIAWNSKPEGLFGLIDFYIHSVAVVIGNNALKIIDQNCYSRAFDAKLLSDSHIQELSFIMKDRKTYLV